MAHREKAPKLWVRRIDLARMTVKNKSRHIGEVGTGREQGGNRDTGRRVEFEDLQVGPTDNNRWGGNMGVWSGGMTACSIDGVGAHPDGNRGRDTDSTRLGILEITMKLKTVIKREIGYEETLTQLRGR